MTDAIIDAEFIAKRLETTRSGPLKMRELCTDLDEDAARWKPGVGKLSVLEHVCHMLEMERAVFGLRMRRILDEDEPTLDPVNEEHYVEEARLRKWTVKEVIEAWAVARQDNVDLVASTRSDQWSRPVNHPDLGRATFADVVDRWSRHDMDHLRQIEIIVLNAGERP